MAPSSHCGSPIILRDTCGLHAVTAPRPSRGGDRTKRRLAHDPWISFNLQPTRITRLVNRLNCYRGTRLQSARTCHGCMGLLSHRTSNPPERPFPCRDKYVVEALACTHGTCTAEGIAGSCPAIQIQAWRHSPSGQPALETFLSHPQHTKQFYILSTTVQVSKSSRSLDIRPTAPPFLFASQTCKSSAGPWHHPF